MKRYIKRAGEFFKRKTEELAAKADENKTVRTLLIVVEVILVFVALAAIFACYLVGLSTAPGELPITNILLILVITGVSVTISMFICHRLLP